MAIYRGYRYQAAGPLVVTKDGKAFSPARSQKVWNHSPDGFQWGYGGSGPAQLALAILLDVTNDEELSVWLHQAFKRNFVAGFGEGWAMTSDGILEWVQNQPKH